MNNELRMLADLIKGKVSVIEAAAWFGFSYDARERNACPICVETSTSRKTLQLDDDGARWWCHSCSEGGDVIDWIAQRLDVKKGVAIQHLAARLGISADPSSVLAYLRSALSDQTREKLASAGVSAALLRSVRRASIKWGNSHVRQRATIEQLKQWEHAWTALTRVAYEGNTSATGAALEMLRRVDPPRVAIRDSHKINAWAAKHYRSCLREIASPYQTWAHKRDLVHDVSAGVGACMMGKSTIGAYCRRREFGIAPLVHAGVLNRGGYDTMQGRVTFPIRDVLGRYIAFGGRLIEQRDGHESGKYVNTRDTDVFRKQFALYGIEHAFESIVETSTAIVVEGYTDVIACRRAGLRNVVASCGTGFTRFHAQCLARWCDRVVLLFDADDAGKRASARAAVELNPLRVITTSVEPPRNMDPDDWVRAHGDAPIREAVHESLASLNAPDSIQWVARKLDRQ